MPGLKISTYQIFVCTFWKKITHREMAAQVGKIQLGSRREVTYKVEKGSLIFFLALDILS